MRRLVVALCTLMVALGVAAPAAHAGPKIGLLTGSVITNIRDDLKKKLEDLKIFDKVDNIDATGAAPSVMTLKQYDAILVYSTSSSSFTFGDPDTTGNNLSTYLDQGGGVVVMNWWMYYNTGIVRGNFITKYNLTDPTFNYRASVVTMGMKLDPTHPILSGVNMVDNRSSSYCYQITGLNVGPHKNGAKVISTWSDGNAQVLVGTGATKQRVDLNMGIASTDAGSYGCWDVKGDGAKLIGNALVFVANPLRATPSAVDFGDVGVMTTSSPQTVVVTNGGSTPVVVNSGAVQPAGEFSVTLNGGKSYPLTLNAGDTFSFDVRLRPSAGGARQSSYVITPAAGMGASPLSISLRGNGIGPRFTAEPGQLDFGGIKFNGAGMTTSMPKLVSLKNSGGGQLRLKSVSITDMANYTLDLKGAVFPNVLTGGASTPVEVKFTPQAKGKFMANIEVNYDLIGGAMNQTAQVPIVGTSGDPEIEIPAANITLQAVRVGKIGPQEYITVKNVGLAQLSITGLSVTGTDAGDFVLESMASMMNPIFVPPNGGEYDIILKFTPKMGGLRRATLNIINDDPDPMRAASKINIAAQGTSATFAITPNTWDFSQGGMTKQQTGTCSPARSFEINNTGDGPLKIEKISFDGMNPSSFRLAGPLPEVPAASKRFVQVSFCPVAIGMQSANLVLETDLMAMHVAKVPLQGIGTGPKVVATPGMVDFGQVYINTTPPSVDVVLKNEGDQNLNFIKSTPPAKPFTVVNLPPDASTLEPGKSITLKVSVTPTMSVQQTGTIEIALNDQVVMGVLRIPLIVTGAQANITVQPKSIMFPPTVVGAKSIEQTLSVANTGMAPLTGMRFTISDQHAAEFSYTGEVPASLDPGKSANFKVSFRPSGDGPRKARLIIKANGLAVDEQVLLEGAGKSLQVTCNPDELLFGMHEVGATATKSVICTNRDSMPLELDLSFDENPNDWEVLAEAGSTLPGAMGGDEGSLTIKVVFKPTDSGPRTSNLVIKAKDSGAIITTVTVDGSGIPKKPEMPMGSCNCTIGRQGPARQATLPFVLLSLFAGVALVLRRRR